MKTKLEKAIDNNHGIYEAVFESLNIPWKKTEDIWYCEEKVPPLNSNLVTRSTLWVPDATFEHIDAKNSEEGWGGWSIKDSFNTLDLEPHGFRKLFEAQWLYLDGDTFAPVESNLKLTFSVAKTTDEFLKWKNVWNKINDNVADQIYTEVLLQDPNLYFVIGKNEHGEEVTACLLNKTDDVIGISNVCVPQEARLMHWSAIFQWVESTLGPVDIVGYERRDLLLELQALGVKAVGDLSVWLTG